MTTSTVEGEAKPDTDPLKSLEAELQQQYAAVWRASPPEFLAHFAAINKVAGNDIPESHAVAVAETSSANTWRESYKLASARFVILAIGQLSFLTLAKWQEFSLPVTVLVPVAFTLLYATYTRLIAKVVSEGAEEMWNKRSFAMKEYVGTVVEAVQKKQAQDERRELR